MKLAEDRVRLWRATRQALCLSLALSAACAPAPKPCEASAEEAVAATQQAHPPAPESRAQPALLLRSRRLGVMGTELFIEALDADAPKLEEALDAAVAELRRIEDLMTDWRASPLMDLNAAAGRGPQRVDPELARLIERSLKISELTGGAFDITYAGVGKLWNFKLDPPVIPSEADIRAGLEFVDYRRVRVDLEASSVELPSGFRIGLGGIAKGYGVDRAMSVLMKRGIEHATVNAGGDLKSLGQKFGEPWKITIRHPRDEQRIIALVPLSNACLVTSGDYERFFVHEGRRYHHIIDPRTGYPSTGCISASVRAPDAAFADALATSLCVMGPEKGLALVEGLPGVDAILVDLEGRVSYTSGLAGQQAGESSAEGPR